MEKIVTTNDLRQAYPELVSKLEDEILIKLGIIDSDSNTKEVMSLTEDEKKIIRQKAKHLAGL